MEGRVAKIPHRNVDIIQYNKQRFENNGNMRMHEPQIIIEPRAQPARKIAKRRPHKAIDEGPIVKSELRGHD